MTDIIYTRIQASLLDEAKAVAMPINVYLYLNFEKTKLTCLNPIQIQY